MLMLEEIIFSYGVRRIFDGLSLRFEPGHFYGVIGPNGSGKSTLLDLLIGCVLPEAGMVSLAGRPLKAYARKALARRMALVPQDIRLDFPYTCAELVMMGRYPHIARFGSPGAEDRRVVGQLLKRADLATMAERNVQRLSGGERQRVVFARALAQETDVLLLDEATAHLDMHHAIGLLNLAARRVATRGALVVAAMQDVNLAAMYCDRMVCLQEGRVFVEGPTAEVLTASMLRAVFGVQARVEEISDASRFVVLTKESV